MSEDTRTFLQRLRDAASEVSYLQKEGYNKHFKYSFLQEAEVKRAVSAALRKHDLYLASVSYEPVGDISGQAATVLCTVTISDTRKPQPQENNHPFGPPTTVEFVRYSGVGSGTDSSDKAPMKACAAALKYALTSGFLIATGDDPEEDGGTQDDKPSGKKGTTSTKSASNDNASKSSSDDIDEMFTKVDAVETADELAKLKIPVSKFRNHERFEELKAAYLKKGAEFKEAA